MVSPISFQTQISQNALIEHIESLSHTSHIFFGEKISHPLQGFPRGFRVKIIFRKFLKTITIGIEEVNNRNDAIRQVNMMRFSFNNQIHELLNILIVREVGSQKEHVGMRRIQLFQAEINIAPTAAV